MIDVRCKRKGRTMNGVCEGCGETAWLVPLHGPDKGGPMRCFMCAGAWNAKYTQRRKWGRAIIRAERMFLDAGGNAQQLKKLKAVAGLARLSIDSGLDFRPGHTDTIGTEVGDITQELLADVLQLVHPDHHPPERRELAKRVTQELLALKPFVFPAPKPKPFRTKPRDASVKEPRAHIKKPSQTYPCELCVDQSAFFYCNACKAEWDKRFREKCERENAKQRKWYAARQERRRRWQKPVLCESCGAKINAKRKDARFCSHKCRQAKHRRTQQIAERKTAAR